MKAATAGTIFPTPSFPAAFKRVLLLAAILAPKPNVLASIPSNRACCQPPSSEPAANMKNDRIDSDKVGSGGWPSIKASNSLTIMPPTGDVFFCVTKYSKRRPQNRGTETAL